MRRLILVLLVLAFQATPVSAASSGDGERMLTPNGVPMFVTAFNYEGPADRAWQMWENDKFDPGLIEADFQRASEQAGANVLRLFVQPALVVDLVANKFDKLDRVVDLAEKHHLQLILSLHDYSERDLSKVTAVAAQLAQRYRNRAGIFAFDLKNEPRFGDLALTKYDKPVPLQQHGLIDALGERMPRDQIAPYRVSDEGSKTIPSYLSDDEAYIYVNNLQLYRDMLADASAWVKEHGGTTLDYLDDAASHQWAPMLAALNGTLEAWLKPQVDAIRGADPGRAVTLDHVDIVLARLPANDVLDYESLHRYPSASAASIRANVKLLTTIEAAHPGKPFVLSEFGYATDTVDPDKAALDEVAITLSLLSQHAAGGAKWMLNDMPEGYNMRERTLGAFRLDGSPKPVVGALGALRGYLDVTGSGVGDLRLEDDPSAGLQFAYSASDALLLGGRNVQSGTSSLSANSPAQVFFTWSEPGLVHIWSSTTTKTTLDLAQVVGQNVSNDISLKRGDGQAAQIGGRNGSVLSLNLEAGNYTLRVGSPPSRGADYDIPNGHFFTQTNGRKGAPSGFAVTDEGGVPLWTGFKALGGVDVLGYPVTRRFQMDGFTVQAFQKSVLQYHPESKSFAFLNTFDLLHERGRDSWLSVYRQTPPPLDTAADAGLPWASVVLRHMKLLDSAPKPLIDAFLADRDWLDHYGLPVAVQDLPNSVVVRAQRASLQYWKEAVPWAAKGSVSVANGGDLAKEAGLFPWLAVTPENAPR